MSYNKTEPMSSDHHDNHHESHPEKPVQPAGESNPMGCLESFFGVFKNLFGCLKNGEEAYTNAPPQLASQLPQSMQMPQTQATTQPPTTTPA